MTAPTDPIAEIRQAAEECRSTHDSPVVAAQCVPSVRKAELLDAYADLLAQVQEVRAYAEEFAKTDIVAEVVLDILDGRTELYPPTREQEPRT